MVGSLPITPSWPTWNCGEIENWNSFFFFFEYFLEEWVGFGHNAMNEEAHFRQKEQHE